MTCLAEPALSNVVAFRPAQPAAAWRPYALNAVLVLALFALLQAWRPYFFLTDDNLTGVLPAYADLGQMLRAGKFPWALESLYGGQASLWRDPSALGLLSPVHIAAALLASTRFGLAAIDAIALVNLLLGALAMQACARAAGRKFGREVPPGLAVFLGVSYVTSYYSLGIGSSWFNFLGNQAMAPVVAWGLLAPRRLFGASLAAAGMLYGLIAGHLSPFFFGGFFLGLFALFLALAERKWEPLWRYAAGCAAALLVVSPVLLGATSGFLGSTRNTFSLPWAMAEFNVPAPALLLGATLGVETLGMWNFPAILGTRAEFALPLAASAAAFCLLAVLATGRRFRAPEWLLVAALAVVALFVHRPAWLQDILTVTPFYRSLRWPMRETMFFLFFAHLLVALGWQNLPALGRQWLPAISAVFFAAAALLSPPPTLNRFPTDRRLLLDGSAARIWARVYDALQPPADCLIVPLLDRWAAHRQYKNRGDFISDAPHTLLGAYNYPPLFGLKSATGYIVPGFSITFRGQEPTLWPGYFEAPQFTAADRADPHLLFTRLISADPVIVEYQLGSKRLQVTLPKPDEAKDQHPHSVL